jgi:hypothetical protein
VRQRPKITGLMRIAFEPRDGFLQLLLGELAPLDLVIAGARAIGVPIRIQSDGAMKFRLAGYDAPETRRHKKTDQMESPSTTAISFA